jgi:hypothetical protein
MKFRIIRLTENCLNPYVVQRDHGVIFSDWRYERSFDTKDAAAAYVKDRVDPDVVGVYGS